MRVKVAAVVLACAALVAGVLAAHVSVATNVSGGDCTQTVSVGADIRNVVAAAADGSTICLDSGNYGSVVLSDVRRSGYVTIKSTSDRGATIQPEIADSDYIHLDSLTLHDGRVTGCSTNVQFTNSTFQQDRAGLWVDGSACTSTTQNYVVDNVTFNNVDQARWEGRLTLRDVNGAQVMNSTFGPDGYGDGIQIIGTSNAIMIGPGNLFTGITQSFCNANGGAHCDAIQGYNDGPFTIQGNYFTSNDVHVGIYDGARSIAIKDNVFVGNSNGHGVSLYGIQGMMLSHNTLRNEAIGVGAKAADPANSGWTVENNVFDASQMVAAGDKPGCGTNCVVRFNLKSRGAYTNPTGTNNVIGDAVFVGPLDSYNSYRLAPGSPGKAAANDGTDMGPSFGEDPLLRIDTGPGVPPSPSLKVELSGRRTQRLGTWVVVRVVCSKACKASAAGRIRVPKARAARRFALRGSTESVVADRRATLRLRVSRKARGAATRALLRRKKVRARVRVTAHDAAGTVAVGQRTIKLRR